MAIARKLRRIMSYPEVLLWQRIRGGASGYKFRKQHPIGPYVVDFCCLPAKLVVEVDGAFHGGALPQSYDSQRDAFLTQNGFRVLRVKASDVTREIDAVFAAIVSLASRPPPPSFGRSPSPCRRG